MEWNIKLSVNDPPFNVERWSMKKHYVQSLRKDFVKSILKKIKSDTNIHQFCGILYSQAYLEKWKTIARKKPMYLFIIYCHDPSEKLLDWYLKPINLIPFFFYGKTHSLL
jgi:hypothetical protein